MADNADKVPENVSGDYYVDEECTGCELCLDRAPTNFKMNDKKTKAFVFKQPDTEEEVQSCEQAIEDCPVDAIGNDG
ncbi:ferredoxin [Methanosalsum natronophilum]|uniref:Ferredoxin n=1 Tax=Methanosalsum natronophilum TaxID=768733 RepID=A0A424Z5C4_9EURY|nr:ferredoxin [Methanosalsum natronophilum]MCS3924732.1 ferredoxin [Methanosalsum natronophilum]RQD92931.1 MAG: ferredoxin [Methanosalsum natronophilum]